MIVRIFLVGAALLVLVLGFGMEASTGRVPTSLAELCKIFFYSISVANLVLVFMRLMGRGSGYRLPHKTVFVSFFLAVLLVYILSTWVRALQGLDVFFNVSLALILMAMLWPERFRRNQHSAHKAG